MKKVLLTGNEGFIGKNIYRKLSKNDRISDIFLIEGDFVNRSNWIKELDHTVKSSDYILHVGAISDTMLQDANKMMKYNFEFSKSLFDSAADHNKTVIYSSSAANTGESGLPSNIYGWSKYIAEQYGMAKLNNFIALRYFNVYGPGEENKGKMSSVAYQAYKRGSFRLFPKEPKRDFVYIDDVVDATIFPIFNSVEKNVYEVGSGQARTFEDVLSAMGLKFDYHDEKSIPNGYQFFTKADNKKFIKGWKPKYMLEDGIKSYLKYLSK